MVDSLFSSFFEEEIFILKFVSVLISWDIAVWIQEEASETDFAANLLMLSFLAEAEDKISHSVLTKRPRSLVNFFFSRYS